MGFLVDLLISLYYGRSFTIGGVVAGMAGTGLLGHRVGSLRSREDAVPRAEGGVPAVAQPVGCEVRRDEPPDPDLVRLIDAVIPNQDQEAWCAFPKAGDQAGMALAVLLSWQLEWLALIVQEGLELYQREWELERSRGTDRVTSAFYDIAQRAWFQMRRSVFDNRYRRLLREYPGLTSFCEGIERIRDEFSMGVRDHLLMAKGNPAMAGEAQRIAAAKVEELIERATDLRQDIGEWQERTRREATALRGRLQAPVGA